MPFFLVIRRDKDGGPPSTAFVEAETLKRARESSQDELTEIVTCFELQPDRVAPEFMGLVMTLVGFSEDFDEGIGGLLNEAIRLGYEIGQQD